jgi:hypothetical protein
MAGMTPPDVLEVLQAALLDVGDTLKRLPGRSVASGLHETRELGPALCASAIRQGWPVADAACNEPVRRLRHWNRPDSRVDLVLRASGAIAAAAELKVWDIGHQLFDLAKVCCLLGGGAHHGLLVCVAKSEADFGRQAGGELFPSIAGEQRTHNFGELVGRHRREWLRHLGKGGPEPTAVPATVTTTAIAQGIEIKAYPGHSLRAVEVKIAESGWISLP